MSKTVMIAEGDDTAVWIIACRLRNQVDNKLLRRDQGTLLIEILQVKEVV